MIMLMFDIFSVHIFHKNYGSVLGLLYPKVTKCLPQKEIFLLLKLSFIAKFVDYLL